MKYLKGNTELIILVLIVYVAFVISTCVFLNIIPTGVDLKIDEFNIKTISVISMLFFGFATWGLVKLMKSKI